MKSKTKPLLIVLTPVFNEAWILPAFLKATSLWADYIIIADQMSTDGCRDLYPQFEKVILVDNPRKEMHMSETRQMLFNEAKKIKGDKIVFTFDADEFPSGDFIHSKGWQTIINSVPGDVFEFKWMALRPTCTQYNLWPPIPYYWAAHLDDELLDGEYPELFIHEWRLPWPKHVHKEYYIDDILLIHFAEANAPRQYNKDRYYQVLQYSHPSNKSGGVAFHRMYTSRDRGAAIPVPNDAYAYYEANGLDLWKEIDLTDEGAHYTRVVLDKIQEVGASSLRKLDIWDPEFLRKNNLQDPRRPIDKLMHWYLRKTKKIAKTFIMRCIDYVLKRLY